MNAVLTGHACNHEVQTITQVFFPNESYVRVQDPALQGLTVVSILTEKACRGVLYADGEMLWEECCPLKESADVTEQKRLIKYTLYQVLHRYTGRTSPWGLLTGIRPAKLVHTCWAEGMEDGQVLAYLQQNFLMEEEKAELCLSVARAERRILEQSRETDVGLYIGIPFCPTRCLYCSFTSYPMGKFSHMVKDYLTALYQELDWIHGFIPNQQIETLYIGGGTPAALTDGDLDDFLSHVETLFHTQSLKEVTIEAGRPDVLTPFKLARMKQAGATRISINTQSMQNRTLERIGREHTAEEFVAAFELARQAGFDNINVDLILGLPGEGLSDVQDTVEKVQKLRPEGITVHTLSVKRASRLKEELSDHALTGEAVLKDMLSFVREAMARAEYLPYYMYRQKNMLGNFENVGYCLRGRECVYNVQMMEEKQNILAAGAGSSTKKVDRSTGRIDRIFNVKNVEEYIRRIDEMIQRKITAFQEL